jgi:hypothetical protein
MKKGAFRFPMIKVDGGGGESPDPAVFCPANGYIPNPVSIDDGWVLLAEFYNLSPAISTFDPTMFVNSGQYAWDLGDGSIIIGTLSISHQYLTTEIRTTKLYGKGVCSIRSIDFRSDNIYGELDLTNEAFSALEIIYLNLMPQTTQVYFPSICTGVVSYLYLGSGITGVLNIEMFATFGTSAYLNLLQNAQMTGVVFGPSISGTFAELVVSACNITGAFDLSMFSSFTSSGKFDIGGNPNLTSIIFAGSISGSFAYLGFNTLGISGVLDLRVFTSLNTAGIIYVNSNPNVTSVLFAPSMTGFLGTMYASSTGIVGVLDMTMFTVLTATANLRFELNPTLTGINFASSVTGSLSTLYIYSTGIAGVLNLSMFTSYAATATLFLYSNPQLTGVLFSATAITGFVRTLRLYSNTNLGYVDFTKLKTGTSSLNWDMKSNGWSAAIVNRILVDIDSISASGFTGRSINIGGTNADPDSSSGGYNGVVARTSLIVKGFTVTIT